MRHADFRSFKMPWSYRMIQFGDVIFWLVLDNRS